ncbi:hypothetical protein GGR51DRAFT_563107 [Nemania sp. FL0031]|nr:hypothetical protein GGR51DRAFT_563107 [Nemania sp. FL0031]
MDRTDEELDRDWVPNGRRPQSTIARSFSAELMDIFRIDNSVADLDEQIDRRKQQVNTGQTELQALEARLKEMEARLQLSKIDGVGGSPRAQRQPLANAFDSTSTTTTQQQQPTEKELPQRPLQTTSSRPGTAKQTQHAPMHGGAMPPTPTASEGESDLVNSSSSHHDRDAETASFADYLGPGVTKEVKFLVCGQDLGAILSLGMNKIWISYGIPRTKTAGFRIFGRITRSGSVWIRKSKADHRTKGTRVRGSSNPHILSVRAQ